MVKIPYFSKKYEKDHYPLINEDIDSYNIIIERYPSIDVIPKENEMYNIWQPETVHFTKEGHRLFGETLYQKMIPFLK